MKVFAHVPVEKVWHPSGGMTYRSEVMEVEVESLHRSPTSLRYKTGRYYYFIKVKDPSRYSQMTDAMMFHGTINLNRKLNPKWKPPVFPDGQNSIVFE